MRLPLLVVLMCALGVTIVGFKPDHHRQDVETFRGRTAEQWFQRAAQRRDERDRVQQLLTRRVIQVHRLERRLAVRPFNLDPITAIRLVFGPYADEAIRVSNCETGGTFSVYARNGQYLGLFQMGDYARSRYGHGWTALEQARAAYRYFVDSGRTWGPWECKP